MESSGGSDKFGGGDGFKPLVLAAPGETLTDRVNRELAARGIKQRIVMVVDDPLVQDRILRHQMEKIDRLFAQRDEPMSAPNQRYVDEITRMPNSARKAAAEAKRACKNAKRLADLEASR